MNLWSLPLIAGLSLALPLVPTSAEAPGQEGTSAANAFTGVGEAGFSYRWISDEDIEAEHLECNSYSMCSFADIVGPRCPHEVFIALDYFDKNDDQLSSGGDILSSSGRQRHIHVELGTNNHDWVKSFEVTDIGCYLGLPTGTPDL